MWNDCSKEGGVKVNNYYAYEIDKYAIKTTLHNFPEIQEMGDVFNADFTQYRGFDLLIGGSPCTYWSIAQTNNRETEASGQGWELFMQYVKALQIVKPKFFIYENNKSMSKSIRESIIKIFGFEPICINSALVSAQNRNRLYWVGCRNNDGTYEKVEIPQPEDKCVLLKDVLDGMADRDKSRTIIGSIGRTTTREYFITHQGQRSFEPVGVTKNNKSYCLTAGYANGSGENIGNYVVHTLDKGCKSMVAEPVNTINDKSQTIKAQYQQTSIANICCYSSTYGASGVAEPVRVGALPRPNGKLSTSQGMRIYSIEGKSVNLTSGGGGMGGKTGLYAIPIEFKGDIPIKAQSYADGKTYTAYEIKNGLITIKGKEYPIKLPNGFYIIRKLTVSECKRLQTVPDWYEFPVSDSQAYKMLGNGWTVDVIAHILKGLTEEC